MMPGQIPTLQRPLGPVLEKGHHYHLHHHNQNHLQPPHQSHPQQHPRLSPNRPHSLPPHASLGLPQQHPTHTQAPTAQTQQHQQPQHAKTRSEHQRRGSVDRSSVKDSSKSSPALKAQPEYVGPYLLGKTLGKGSSGCVKLAFHRKTDEPVAVKIISKASLANRAAVHRGIEREIAIMKLINHPHVIRLYDVYETEKELFLVMEYVSGGELFEYLVNKGRLEEAEALRFFQQIIVGLAFCHKRKVCHRDLKPENLLLDTQMNVKIADFGMASLQKTGRLLETSCGSPHYASPEVVTGMKYDGSSSDIWSCGIILYALLTGHLPFDDENIRQLLSKVKAGKFYMPTDISPGARDLISRMLTVNPRRRITMQGVMMHPWFRIVNPVRNTLKEPVQEPEDARPLEIEELDAEIIRHMRWLFAPGPSHADPEGKTVFDEEALLVEIQEKVTNKEENMEKLFYRLLCQHKTELLENYSGDECDTQPDAPRRRADSFPTSATCSVRSATPDFSLTPLSPGDSPMTSPGSPLSPITKGADPTPLTLNPEQTATNPSAKGGQNPVQLRHMSGIRRGQSPTKVGECKTLRESVHGTTSRRGSDESESSRCNSSSSGSKSIERDHLSTKSTGLKGILKEDSGRGADEAVRLSLTSRVAPSVPMAGNQLPPIHPMDNSAPPPYYLDQDTNSRRHSRPIGDTGNMSGATAATPTIESQVIATQISDAGGSSQSTTRSGLAPTAAIHNGSTASSVCSEQATIRTPRPILHPLDVKPSASTTATNVSASPHTRIYSEGSTGLVSVAPSPTVPKRPWFARLFDFKPQPLTFQSNLSAIETQDRLEMLLKDIFRSSIQVENLKKPPSFGFKCKYEGGVLDEKHVKAVKFKVEIVEKTVFCPHTEALIVAENNGVTTPISSSDSSMSVSSSAVAAILAKVEMQQNRQHQLQLQQQQQSEQQQQQQQQQQQNHRRPQHRRSLFGRHGFSHYINGHGSNGATSGSSSSSSSNGRRSIGALIVVPAAATAVAGPTSTGIQHELPPKMNPGRRASDGGSILSSAAAAVSSHLAARLPFHPGYHHYHQQQQRQQQSHHQHYASSSSSSAGSQSQQSTRSGGQGSYRRVVKVTMNQQQGANSTLKMVHERLLAAWDVYEQQALLEHQRLQQQRQIESLQASVKTHPIL